MAELLTAAWPYVAGAIAAITGYANLRSKVATQAERLARLEARHEALDGKIVEELTAVKVALARIEAYLEAKQGDGKQ